VASEEVAMVQFGTVSIVNKLWAGQPRYHGLIPSTDKILISSPKYPAWLRGSPTLPCNEGVK